MHISVSLVFAISASFVSFSEAVDLTTRPNTYGNEVVEAVVNLIRESCLFADDRRFLRRLAYVESQDGTAPKTYRPGYNGGIWQVDEREFQETQYNSALTKEYDIIQNSLGIDWHTVQWSDLRKPLYSGIAAALYTILKKNGTDLSWKAEQQGDFWAHNFHGHSTAYNFTNFAQILDQGCHTKQEVDLVFVLDTSTSLSNDDFTRGINFISQVVDGFQISPNQTHVSVITYSTRPLIQFYLSNYSNKNSLKSAIQTLRQHTGSTATNQAIDTAVNTVFNQAYGARPGAVKVMVVLTDGDSDDTINTKHAAERAHYAGIVTFSVGIGSSIGQYELNNIASKPECTHAYKVGSFEEIRFMREEIQKATCIAPLYINSTYSCALARCPPLAVLPGLTGTTIETNITCGGMNVYASVNNPYPTSAQYEVKLVTFANSPSQHFFNVSGQTLYINFTDNQINLPGSQYCVATITPYPGDRTHHTYTVKCYFDGIEVPCNDSYFNCTEKWNFGNPCTAENIVSGKTRFPHPYDSNKFLLCDYSGKLFVAICPPGEVFYADCSQCIGLNSTVSADCTTPLATNISNPCTRANILAGKLFFEFPGDHHKFIHCDLWGKPWERNCPTGEEWDQSLETCYMPSAYNPCLHHVPGTPYLYPHECDPHQYIHCDTNHQSWVQSCQSNYLFLRTTQTCVPQGWPGTESYVNTCNGATIYTTTTPWPGNTGTTSLHGYAYSSTTYAEPCTHANIAANRLYFAYKYDNHHYIQCNLYGNAYLMDCAPRFYDPYTFTCVDGPVFVDNLIGKK